jgi:pyridoxine 4-dehydrogenase
MPPSLAFPDQPRLGSVPGVGVGTWAWGNRFLWGYNPAQDEGLKACFDRAVALGLTFFDTADSYGTGQLQGRSEELLGAFCDALPEDCRARLCVATKLAPFPWRLGRRGFDRAFADSRRRLRGKLDLVQLHWSTARYLPWQESPLLEGLADRVEQGEVGALGVSNMGPGRLRSLHSHLAARGVPLRSLQVQLSLLAPEALAPGGVAELCRELGVTLIAYSPLALGLLGRPPGELPSPPSGLRGLLFRRLWPKVQPLLRGIQAIAKERSAEPAEVALNWCRAHGALPIPGLRRVDQAETAAAALSWRMEENERRELDALSLACGSKGARMPANPFLSD